MNDKRKTFLRAQMKFILASAFTYAFFYLTRKNLSMAQPGMLEEGVVTTYQQRFFLKMKDSIDLIRNDMI